MNETGYRNLIHLVSKGYLEGFYYRPRIDLDLLREHSRGPDRHVRVPVLDGVPRDHRGPDATRPGSCVEELSRDLPGPLLPRAPAPRHRRAGPRERRARRRCRSTCICRWSRPTTPTTSSTATTGTTRRCSASAPAPTSTIPNRFRFDGEGFYLKAGDEMAELFHDHPSAVAQHARDRRALRARSRARSGTYHLPEFQVPSSTHARDRARAADGARPARAPRPRAGRAAAAALERVREARRDTSSASSTRWASPATS